MKGMNDTTPPLPLEIKWPFFATDNTQDATRTAPIKGNRRIVIVIIVATAVILHLLRWRQGAPLGHHPAQEAAGHVDDAKILQRSLLAGCSAVFVIFALICSSFPCKIKNS
jgi:hypothetical protein